MASVSTSLQNVFPVSAEAKSGVGEKLDPVMRFCGTPIGGIRAIHAINVIRRIEITTHLFFTLVIKHLQMAGVLLSITSITIWHEVVFARGTMRTAPRNLDRECKQTFGWRKLVCYAIRAQTDQSALPNARRPLGGVLSEKGIMK